MRVVEVLVFGLQRGRHLRPRRPRPRPRLQGHAHPQLRPGRARHGAGVRRAPDDDRASRSAATRPPTAGLLLPGHARRHRRRRACSAWSSTPLVIRRLGQGLAGDVARGHRRRGAAAHDRSRSTCSRPRPGASRGPSTAASACPAPTSIVDWHTVVILAVLAGVAARPRRVLPQPARRRAAGHRPGPVRRRAAGRARSSACGRWRGARPARSARWPACSAPACSRASRPGLVTTHVPDPGVHRRRARRHHVDGRRGRRRLRARHRQPGRHPDRHRATSSTCPARRSWRCCVVLLAVLLVRPAGPPREGERR